MRIFKRTDSYPVDVANPEDDFNSILDGIIDEVQNAKHWYCGHNERMLVDAMVLSEYGIGKARLKELAGEYRWAEEKIEVGKTVSYIAGWVSKQISAG